VKVNLGSGPHPIPGWKNFDLIDHPGVINHDLTTPLPIGDGLVDLIYSEHFLEHIKRPEALRLMKECFRILKPGGVMRISTPALEFLVDHYNAGHTFQLPGAWEPKTPCQMLNGGLHEWGHQFVYDIDELYILLVEAGFEHTKMKRKMWRESDHPELREREVRPWLEELIVEATR
jgi:predicted SAM-dependent methyltransferase